MPPPLPRFRPPLFQATNAANQTRQSGKAINSAHQPLKISNSTQQPTRSASCSFRSQLELTEKLEAKLPLEQEWLLVFFLIYCFLGYTFLLNMFNKFIPYSLLAESFVTSK